MTRQGRLRLTLLVVLLLTLLRLPVALAMRALLPDLSVSPAANYAASIAQSLLMFALPGWLLKPEWRRSPTQGRDGFVWALLTIVAVVAVRGAVTPLNELWSRALGLENAGIPMTEGLPGRVLMLLALVIVPAVAEEIFFRGTLQPRLLMCCSRWQALLLSTLLFALMHGSLAGLPGHLLISLLLSLLMMHTGRLSVTIGAHMVYNALALYWPDEAALLNVGCVLLSCVIVAWLLLRLPRGRERRMARSEGLFCAVILLIMAAQYLI